MHHDRLTLGPLTITFHRTCRVPRKEGLTNELPAGLGAFPLYQVSSFHKNVPDHWKQEGQFMPMYPQEAMWIGFGHPQDPVALLVGAGMVNAITGKRLEEQLSVTPQNYLVVPPQPWLDGFKRQEGASVYQFVAAELGQGETVEEQLTGAADFGGIQFGLYVPKVSLIHAMRPREYVLGGMSGVIRTRGAVRSSAREMGLGVGGAIRQKIYPDPYLEGRSVAEVWGTEVQHKAYIYIVHSNDFKAITGHEPTPTPITYAFYQQHGYPWFGLPDGSWGDVDGNTAFENVKPVSGDPSNPHEPNLTTKKLW